MSERCVYMAVCKAVVHVTGILLLLCSCSGCIAEDVGLQECTISVGFAVSGTPLTRTMDELNLYNVNLYVVNESGAVVTCGYYTSDPKFSAEIYRDMEYSVYAIANAGKFIPASSLRQIEELEHSVSLSGEIVSGGLIMTGYLPLQPLGNNSNITIPLTRCVAKAVIKADMQELNDDVVIDIKSITAKNVPKSVGLFKETRVKDANGAMDGATVAAPSFEKLVQGIPFYMFENMQGNLEEGNPQTCSYVELAANYSSPRKAGEILYRFYLGKNMVGNYDVKRNTQYNVTVSFKGDGAVDENSWRVDNSAIEDVVPPEIAFDRSSMVMYDLEEGTIRFAVLRPEGASVEVASSDCSVVEVLEYDSGGIRIRALSPGKATVTARANGIEVECGITVEKLRIVPQVSSITLFNHFYGQINYTVYPEHASAMKVVCSSSNEALVVGYNGVENRIIPQFAPNAELPCKESVTLALQGREDVKAYVEVTVNPMLQLEEEIVVNANMGNSTLVKNLNLTTAESAKVSVEWVPNDGVKIYGNPGSNILVSDDFSTLSFPIPNGANGYYRLKASVIGDDGYGSDETMHTDAVKYCNITVYETIYLVGISKTMNREKVASSTDSWIYENEIVAKWLTHPYSMLFGAGEIELDIGFVYNGVEYESNHTEFSETIEFSFTYGEQIELSLEEGIMTYRGTAPKYYYEYFYLQPLSSPYIRGNMLTGEPYLYIHSRNFAGGFANSAPPNWKKIFEYIYR